MNAPAALANDIVVSATRDMLREHCGEMAAVLMDMRTVREKWSKADRKPTTVEAKQLFENARRIVKDANHRDTLVAAWLSELAELVNGEQAVALDEARCEFVMVVAETKTEAERIAALAD